VNDADIVADVAAAPAARHSAEEADNSDPEADEAGEAEEADNSDPEADEAGEAEEADNSDGVMGLSRTQVSMAALDGNSQTEAATELKV
jgi:hypothetical protein